MPRKTWLKKLGQKNGKTLKKKSRIIDQQKIDLGTFKIEKTGKNIKFSTLNDKNMQQSLKRAIKIPKKDQKEFIYQKIQYALYLLSEYDPLKILSSIALESIITDPETYVDSISPMK